MPQLPITTLKGLLEALPLDGWRVERDGAIRRRVDGDEHCPITAACLALTGARWHPEEYDRAAEALGMPLDLTWRVAEAADEPHAPFPFVREIRERLLAALRPEGT